MRIRIYSIILIIFLIILISGLVHIQVGMQDRFTAMSEGNRLKVVPLMAPRGCILDAGGRPLVKDVLSFNASVIYNRIKDMDSLAEVLSSVLDIPKEEIVSGIRKCRAMPYSPVCVMPDIGIEKAVQLEELGTDIPGLMIEVSAKRKYLYQEGASNILGYLGSINRSEFDRLKHYGYRVDDLVGRDGIEKYYDDYLRGKHGGKQVEVDHRGREEMTLGYKEPIPGKDVYLTIDLDLQEYCDSLMKDKRGAIIAMNPSTGGILAMTSAPSYDPGVFIDYYRKKEISGLLNDRRYPLLNRAIKGTYPPGSIFKAIVAVAALETDSINEETLFLCNGSINLGRRAFHCWKKSGHGDQNLISAIRHSCNVFFWRTGLILGVDNIADYAKRFGVGEKTGIDLPGEEAGLLPSREWKEKRFKEPWYRGETLNYSVGQGYLLCSPIQIARIMSVFANKGYLVKPFVVKKVGDVTINTVERKKLDISPESLDTVREGLREVVNSRRGTGMKARLKNVIVSGKTGTAQTSKGKDHGWFAGFAPFNNARLTVVVFDEYGGKGGYYAAQTAGEVFRKAEELGLLAESDSGRKL